MSNPSSEDVAGAIIGTDPAARAVADAWAKGNDPSCRYAKAYPETHQCRRNTGEPIRRGETCYLEAAKQSIEQAASERLQREFLAITGLDRTLDDIERAQDAIQRREDQREDMALSAEVDEDERCTLYACGGRPGPAHGPCREHRSVHCSAEGCW